MCLSIAYEGCQTPFILWEGMWEPFHVESDPQPLHNGIVCSSAVIQDFKRLPRSGPTHEVIMA